MRYRNSHDSSAALVACGMVVLVGLFGIGVLLTLVWP